jgi:hypothetical protein
VKTLNAVTTTDSSLHNCQLLGTKEKKTKKIYSTDLKKRKRIDMKKAERTRKFGGHRRQGKEEGSKPFQIPLFPGSSSRQHVNPHAASGGGAWSKCSTTVPFVQGVLKHCSCIFQKALDFLGFIL